MKLIRETQFPTTFVTNKSHETPNKQTYVIETHFQTETKVCQISATFVTYKIVTKIQ